MIRIVFILLVALACDQVRAETIATGAIGCPSKILLKRQMRLIEKGDYRMVSGCWSHREGIKARVIRSGIRATMVRRIGSPANYFVSTYMVDENDE